MRQFVFYLSSGLVRVCKIELSNMGNNCYSGNLDLVCEKHVRQHGRLTEAYAIHFVSTKKHVLSLIMFCIKNIHGGDARGLLC